MIAQEECKLLADTIANHGRNLLKLAEWLAEGRYLGDWTGEPSEIREYCERIHIDLIRGKALLTGVALEEV